MTTTYFESINDNLTVQITDDFTNYALWKKGRCGARQGPGSASVLFEPNFALSPSGSIPIIVYDISPYSASTGLLVLSESFKNGVASVSAYSSEASRPAAQCFLDYYVYLPANDPAVTVSSGGLFTLFDENGRVVFDSEASYLKVIDYVDHNYAAANDLRRYPVKKVGIVVSRAQWFVNAANSPGGWNQVAGAAALANYGGKLNEVMFSYVPFRYLTGPGGVWPLPRPYGNQSLLAMVCDITNLDKLPYDIIQ